MEATEESPKDILLKSVVESPPMDPRGGGGEGSSTPPATTIGDWGGTGHFPIGWTAGAGMFTTLAWTGAGTAGAAGVWSQIGSHQCCMCSNCPGASWPRISSLEDASYCKGGASQLHPSITAYYYKVGLHIII